MRFVESIESVAAFGGKFLEYILKAVLVKKEDMQICQSLTGFSLKELMLCINYSTKSCPWYSSVC